jgi:hypothetical protein
VPAPVVAGLIGYLQAQLGVQCFDGEIQRYDLQGRPINPVAGQTTTPRSWPAVAVKMTEAGFQRNPTFEDPYDDQGELLVECWGTRRDQLETPPVLDPTDYAIMDRVEQLLSAASNWPNIILGGPSSNPYYVVGCLLLRWSSVQQENIRTAQGQMLYKGELWWQVDVHGAVPTG